MLISPIKNSPNFEGHKPRQEFVGLMAQIPDTDSIIGITETFVKQNRDLNALSIDVITKLGSGRNADGGFVGTIFGDVVDLETNKNTKRYFSKRMDLENLKGSVEEYLKLVEQEISRFKEPLTENIDRTTGKVIKTMKKQLSKIKGDPRARVEQRKGILLEGYTKLFGK